MWRGVCFLFFFYISLFCIAVLVVFILLFLKNLKIISGIRIATFGGLFSKTFIFLLLLQAVFILFLF